MAQQFVISEGCGSDLKAGDMKLGDEVDRGFIPARREPVDLDLTAIAVNFPILFDLEFQPALQIAVGVAKRAFPGLRQFLRRVDNIDRPLLKLHGVTTGPRGYVD